MLIDRWKEKQQGELYRVGTVTAAIYNTVRDTSKRPWPFTAEDIFPSLALARQQQVSDEDEFLDEQTSDPAAVDTFFHSLAKQQNGKNG